MTGKQKTLKAFNFEEIDDVVYGEYGIDCDIVSRVLGHETYLRNKAASTIGLWEGRRDEVVQSWKEDLVELCGKLDLDIVVATIVPSVNDRFEKPEKIGEGIYRFRNGEVVKYSSVTNDFLIVKRADKTHG